MLDALNLSRTISTECGFGSDWRENGLRKTILEKFETDMVTRTTSKVIDSRQSVELLHSDAVMHEGDEPRSRGLQSKD